MRHLGGAYGGLWVYTTMSLRLRSAYELMLDDLVCFAQRRRWYLVIWEAMVLPRRPRGCARALAVR